MRYLIFTLLIGFVVLLFSFREKNAVEITSNNEVTTNNASKENRVEVSCTDIEKTDQSAEFVEYAKTLIGTPYLYGSTDPAKGLDCSGFINAVSNHFGIKVPRSSVEFTDMGNTIETDNVRPGDFILFTGTDPNTRVVGHIGIITNNQDGEVEFIHSSSGKAKGVTISELDGYYEKRFVKVIRIFPTATGDV